MRLLLTLPLVSLQLGKVGHHPLLPRMTTTNQTGDDIFRGRAHPMYQSETFFTCERSTHSLPSSLLTSFHQCCLGIYLPSLSYYHTTAPYTTAGTFYLPHSFPEHQTLIVALRLLSQTFTFECLKLSEKLTSIHNLSRHYFVLKYHNKKLSAVHFRSFTRFLFLITIIHISPL